METNETHYIHYDPELLWEQMHLAYIASGGDLLYPGDEKEILLRSVQAIVEQEFAVVDNALRMDTLRYAVDDYLDLYGQKRNCYRIEAKKATAPVAITFIATMVKTTIPAGTPMTADGTHIYVTAEDIVQTGYAQTTNTTIVAEDEGIGGNGLISGTTMQLVTGNDAITGIVVTANASGGVDRESDESYRERIREYGLASITTGPRQQYESAARAVSADVLDACAVMTAACAVSVYLIISEDASADDVISGVEGALNAENVRPLTDNVTVLEATSKEYELDVDVTLENGLTEADMEGAVNDYREWQDNTIGRAFNPDKLMAMLYQAGASRVQWADTSHFNNGEIAYTTIGSSERCSGTIQLTVATEREEE